ncbi:MAG: Na+/H+ antiporter, partial [Acidimicrobiia bacterium]
RARFPFTVALVLAGFVAAGFGEIVDVEVSADLILALLVPPLLFEATLNLPWTKLRRELFGVLTLALAGTMMGSLAVGTVVHFVLDIPWALSFAFGALISATDPVAVIAFFKSLGTPKRLSVLVEGESLFNDAVAVVVFGVALDVAAGESFVLSDSIADFFIVSAGGLAVGMALGFVVSEVVLAGVDDALIETSTTLALAFGSFLLAEEFGALIGQDDLHFSGILAVVAAGLMVGTRGIQNTSPTTRLTLEHFWELLTFLVNSLVFLVIGLTIGLGDLFREWWPVLLAVVTVLVVRAILVYGLTWFTNLLRPSRRVPGPYQHVMFWGGLRGAISLALALIIQENEELREVVGDTAVQTVVVMTFGVVLFTLLVQGLSIAGLIRHLGLAGRTERELEQQTFQAKIHMRRAGQETIDRLGDEGVIGRDMAESLQVTYRQDVVEAADRLQGHMSRHPELEAEMLLQARRESLVAEGSALGDIVRTGLIENQVADLLSVQLNHRLAALEILSDRWEIDPLDIERGER